MPAVWRRLVAFTGIACLQGVPAVSAFDNVRLDGGGGTYSISTSTLKDYRYRDVTVQQRDFSCGSAALATLLKYHYDMPITETEVLQAMYETGDKEKIEREGFSLLDMKRYLASQQLQSEGYKVSLDKLAKVGVPAIVLINMKGYLHFVVIRGLRGEEVLIADPAQGMKTFDRATFEEMWNGVIFVIVNHKQKGTESFNLARYWGLSLGDHRLEDIVTENSLAASTLHNAPTPGYY